MKQTPHFFFRTAHQNISTGSFNHLVFIKTQCPEFSKRLTLASVIPRADRFCNIFLYRNIVSTYNS